MAAARKYEGLFILDTAGREESVKDIIDKGNDAGSIHMLLPN